MLPSAKAFVKMLLLIVWIALCYPFVWLAYKLKKPKLRDRLAKFGFRGLLRIIGVSVRVTGSHSDLRPQLLVTNHISYLDIPILCCYTDAYFTPKAEIAKWPVIGSATNISGAIYVDRRPEKVLEMKQRLQTALAGNHALCLFPESTTGNGLRLQPFRSGFFSLAEEPVNGRELAVQPAALTYTHIRNLPIDTTQWPTIAWYGDMELVPHLWELLKLAPIEAELVFLPPVTLSQYGNRKKLAAHCQQVIGDTIQSIRQRRHDIAVPKARFHPKFLRLRN